MHFSALANGNRRRLRSAFPSALNYSYGVWPGWKIIHQLPGLSSLSEFIFKTIRRLGVCVQENYTLDHL